MFEEILEFNNVTILYYGRKKYVALQQKKTSSPNVCYC
jgi:hypothetical protein